MALSTVSIVIPTYNGGALVDRTILSARRQTYASLEIIVVDDGSTDETPGVIERHAKEDRRIRIVSQENRGVAAARSRGIAEARGTLIAFLDHDDLWSPDHIQSQVSRIALCDADTAVVYSWSCLIDLEDRILSPSDEPQFEGQVFPELCRRNFIGNGSAGMVRKSALEGVGGFEETLAGQDDYNVYLKLAERYKFVCTRQVSVGYRLVPGSGADSTKKFLRSFRGAIAPFRSRYPEYDDRFEIQEKEIVQWCCSRALYGGRLGDAATLILSLAELDLPFALYSAAFVVARPLLMLTRRRRSRMPEKFGAAQSASMPS